MQNGTRNNPHIIGLTGSFGSGCSEILSKNILQKRDYQPLSLSEDVLKPLYKKETGKNWKDCPRKDRQKFGDDIRQKHGLGYLAQSVLKKITNSSSNSKWVIDSIRNPEEIYVLRRFSRNFFLFGIYAERETRWERVKNKYNNDKKAFDEDDLNDKGEDNLGFGQRVGDCFYESDIVIKNEKKYAAIGNADFNDFANRVGQYVDLVSSPLNKQRPLGPEESLMAMAYAIGWRSSCLKRKVGAVIIDPLGNVISSGFNEVPGNEKPCKEEYTHCYRDWTCKKFFEELQERIPAIKDKEKEYTALFRKRFKILDYCRALHAEENAIVNLARNGRSVPLDQCTLYCTTYPCRMCANKIVQSGIRSIVYLESYPDPEAKIILRNAGVTDNLFEGVTFRAYFRLYGEEK